MADEKLSAEEQEIMDELVAEETAAESEGSVDASNADVSAPEETVEDVKEDIIDEDEDCDEDAGDVDTTDVLDLDEDIVVPEEEKVEELDAVGKLLKELKTLCGKVVVTPATSERILTTFRKVVSTTLAKDEAETYERIYGFFRTERNCALAPETVLQGLENLSSDEMLRIQIFYGAMIKTLDNETMKKKGAIDFERIRAVLGSDVFTNFVIRKFEM